MWQWCVATILGNLVLVINNTYVCLTFIFQLIDENKDNMINFKEFVYILGVVCKADLTHKLKLLYICHQPPALLPTDKLDEIVSPLSSKSFYQVMYVSKRQAQQCSGFKQVNGITPPPFEICL